MFAFLFKKKGPKTMSIRPIDHSYHVTGQISPESLAHLKQEGYAAIVCLRPDNEGPGQPLFAAIKSAADAVGIPAYYLPVTPGSQPFAQATELKKILKATNGPILAYCASGNRASVAYQLAQQIG
jgi:uncharacterized protein (TIGR01244 family)